MRAPLIEVLLRRMSKLQFNGCRLRGRRRRVFRTLAFVLHGR